MVIFNRATSKASGADEIDDDARARPSVTFHTFRTSLHRFPIMRLSILPVAFALAAGVSAQQKPLQVYLHPTPAASAPDSPPTLSADQAKAVLAHHLGQPIDDFEEIPSDEGLWTHLMGMWSGEKVLGAEEKARVVIIEGGVMPQGE